MAGTDPVLLYSAAGTGTSCVLSTYGTPLLSDDPLSCDDDGLDSIPFNPGEGLAVHRIVPSGPDSESNWVASDPTPGGDPPGVETGLDFSPVALDLEPPFGEDGTMVSLSARVANLGAEQASQGELELWLYEDLDFSGSPSPSEIILSLLPDPPAPGDSVEISTAWPAPGTAMTVGIYTVCAGDTTVSDDSLSMIWNRPCDIVINEIMYHPAPGDPEWIELSNSSADSLDMAGLILSDSREEVLVTDSSIVIAPGAFVIVASDSSAFREVWPGLDCPVIEPPSWPALNDQTQPGEGYADDVRLTLPGGQGADMVPYDDSWGGGAGISLEKTDPGARGWLPGSWSSCTGDATPGTQNSVYSPGS
ncbi:MAG TPA: lamin tail domain-containing protein, partial [Candidatus Fermentibacter sp.]|nr:lamin tail domain-containing protein [Candidatus Fermentibacter sp.]